MRHRSMMIVLITTVLTVASAATAGAAPAVDPPSGLTATVVSAREAALTWNPVNGALAYRVLWGVDPNEMIVLDETTQTTYRHPYLAPATTYVYAVQTVGRRGVSVPSPVVSVTTPPEAPVGLQAEVIKADQVQLSWYPAVGATSYAVSEVRPDGSETPATVLESSDSGALVQTVASTSYVFRVRSVANGIASIDYATASVTTPPREPAVINHTSPSPVPAGDTVLTFRVDGTQTLQPTSGTLDVSIDGGPAAQIVVEQSMASLPLSLTPGTYSMAATYSGDGAFLPSSNSWTFFVAPPIPSFATEIVDPSTDVYAVAAADVTCDGRTDLITSNSGYGSTGPRLDLRPGLPGGAFGDPQATPLNSVAFSLATGDLNGDGCADLAAAVGGELWTFQGSASGLVRGARVRGVDGVSKVELRDLTGDGLLDAVVGHGGLSVLPGNGRSGFGRATTIVAAQQSFGVGDLDGDGRLDVATVHQEQVHAWGQSATGQFVLRWTSWIGPTGVVVGDVTGDGSADIVVGADGGLSVLSGLDGHQVGGVPGIIWQPIIMATIGDVDGNGMSDIVSVDGYSGAVGISLSWAGAPTAQQYAWPNPWVTAVRDGGLLVTDVSGDGRADIVAVDVGWGVMVLRQQ